MGFKALRDRLLVQEAGEELVVYDRDRHRAHRLNKAAALVWNHCDGRRTPADLAALLGQELGLPADEGVARLALDRLARAGLVEGGQVETEGERPSRRQVVRRLGLGAAMALALPAVTTLAAPAPANSVSPPNHLSKRDLTF